MPSPLAHVAAGFLAGGALLAAPRSATPGPGIGRSSWRLLVAAMALSLLPDVTTVAGIVTGNLGRFHNSWEHSLVLGVAAALIAGLLGSLGGRGAGARWFGLTLITYELHVVMDLFTIGRGVKILWPFSAERFSPPFKLFYGFHWSDGWLTPRHLITLLTEFLFVAALVLALLLWNRRRRGADPAAADRARGALVDRGPR